MGKLFAGQVSQSGPVVLATLEPHMKMYVYLLCAIMVDFIAIEFLFF